MITIQQIDAVENACRRLREVLAQKEKIEIATCTLELKKETEQELQAALKKRQDSDIVEAQTGLFSAMQAAGITIPGIVTGEDIKP